MVIQVLEDSSKAIACLNEAFSLKNESVDLAGYMGKKIDSYTYYGAFEEDCLMGVIAYDEDNSRIVLVGVLDAYRKRGVASSLIRYVIDLAEQESKTRLRVEVIHSQVEFFNGFGFEAVGHFNDEDLKVEMEYLIACKYLGKAVTVTVDKPFGSFHEYKADVEYPCNVGYVEEILKNEGEFVEAIVYNVLEPVESFSGVVMAVVFEKESEICRLVVSKQAKIDQEVLLKDIGPLVENKSVRIVYVRCDKN